MRTPIWSVKTRNIKRHAIIISQVSTVITRLSVSRIWLHSNMHVDNLSTAWLRRLEGLVHADVERAADAVLTEGDGGVDTLGPHSHGEDPAIFQSRGPRQYTGVPVILKQREREREREGARAYAERNKREVYIDICEIKVWKWKCNVCGQWSVNLCICYKCTAFNVLCINELCVCLYVLGCSKYVQLGLHCGCLE